MDPKTIDPELQLRGISNAITSFFTRTDTRALFDDILANLLQLTASEYGFVGRIERQPDGSPALRTHAITNIAWNEETRRLYEENRVRGMLFTNLNSLFGAAIVTQRPVIANEPLTDPRRTGTPGGHPPLEAFLGIPLLAGAELVGLVGLANREGGYDEGIIEDLAPMVQTCAALVKDLMTRTEREEAVAALLEAEARSAAILETAADAIITIDVDGRILSSNSSAERMLGYAAESLIGRHVSLLMPEPHRGNHDQYVNRYLTTGNRRVIGIGREVEAIHRDGTTVPVELSVSEVRVGERTLFTGVLRDIRQRKLSEEQLLRTVKELRKSKADLMAVLNELRIGSIVLDPNGIVMFVSDNTPCHGLVERSEMVGQPWHEVIPLHPAGERELASMMAHPPGKAKHVEHQVQRNGEAACWIDFEVHEDPREPQQRILFLQDISELVALRQSRNQSAFHRLIGRSKAMQGLFTLIEQVARGDWTALVEGETGVGKELVAHAIHETSPRASGPFVAMNCSALSESLLASQLFGHKRGAFTGATHDQLGLFEAAEGGTLFLDEIGDVTPSVQTSLLRALQEKEITRVGESQPRKVNARIVAATHQDLARKVEEGSFRADLYYRLRVARIHVPPLRERRADIPLLAQAFLDEPSPLSPRKPKAFAPEALRALLEHDWPGNVRELKSAVQFAVIGGETPLVQLGDLPPEIRGRSEPVPQTPPAVAKARAEGDIMAAIEQAGGNRAKAARLLGISRATLYRRLGELELDE